MKRKWVIVESDLWDIFLILSPFPLNFIILSPFPLNSLILSPFSHSQAARLAQLVQPACLLPVTLSGRFNCVAARLDCRTCGACCQEKLHLSLDMVTSAKPIFNKALALDHMTFHFFYILIFECVVHAAKSKLHLINSWDIDCLLWKTVYNKARAMVQMTIHSVISLLYVFSEKAFICLQPEKGFLTSAIQVYIL